MIFNVVALCVAALALVLVAIFTYFVLFDRPRTVHWAHNEDEVKLRQLPDGEHHLFLSHSWHTGQDQAKTVKLLSKELLPSIKAYLDVDEALDRDSKPLGRLFDIMRDEKKAPPDAGADSKHARGSARRLTSRLTSFALASIGVSQAKLSAQNEADQDWMQLNVGNSEMLVAILTGGTRAKSNEEQPKSPVASIRDSSLKQSRVHHGTDIDHRTSNIPGMLQRAGSSAILMGGEHYKSDYFSSKACLKEIGTAVDAGKRIVCLLETDCKHGGVPLCVHDEALKKGIVRAQKDYEREQRKSRCGDSVGSVSSDKTKRKGELEQYKRLHDSFLASTDRADPSSSGGATTTTNVKIIPWYRYKELQEVSIRLLLQSLLQVEARPDSEEENGTIWINGELDRQGWKLRAPTGGRKYHLFVSEWNVGAKEFTDWLHKYLIEAKLDGSEKLRITHDTKDLTDGLCGHFLVYLNRDTWNDPDSSESLSFIEDVTKAIDSMGDKAACLVHEMRHDYNGEFEFDPIYKKTPQGVVKDLYSAICLPITDGTVGCKSPEHERASVQLLLRRLCPKSTIDHLPHVPYATNVQRVPKISHRLSVVSDEQEISAAAHFTPMQNAVKMARSMALEGKKTTSFRAALETVSKMTRSRKGSTVSRRKWGSRAPPPIEEDDSSQPATELAASSQCASKTPSNTSNRSDDLRQASSKRDPSDERGSVREPPSLGEVRLGEEILGEEILGVETLGEEPRQWRSTVRPTTAIQDELSFASHSMPKANDEEGQDDPSSYVQPADGPSAKPCVLPLARRFSSGVVHEEAHEEAQGHGVDRKISIDAANLPNVEHMARTMSSKAKVDGTTVYNGCHLEK